jgi:transposase InsO family protein
VWVLASIRITRMEVLVVHANAKLAPAGRLALAECIVEDGWPLRRAAERFQVSVPTAQRWSSRYRERDTSVPALEAMQDVSSRPECSPRQTRPPKVRKILHLRKRGWGPARIGHKLRMHPSTVGRVLRREGAALLSEVDLATRKELRGKVKRYEHDAPGDLIHVDVKKLGKIPDGGGHRIHGRQRGKVNSRLMGTVNKTLTGARGYGYVHTALDDHSRLAYSEVLADETAATATAWWRRAIAWFAAQGVTIKAVLSDNGSCYRSNLWKAACGDHTIKHRRTRPYRPQTNGKVERFHRTLAHEWAYVRPYPSERARVVALRKWLHLYNHHRTHTAIGGVPPASRVTNLSGQYI